MDEVWVACYLRNALAMSYISLINAQEASVYLVVL